MNRPSGRPLPPFGAVILDLDGLVLDTESAYCLAWQRAAAELGTRLTDEFCRNLFGRHADDVMKALGAALGRAFDRRQFLEAAERHWRIHLDRQGIALMPGAADLLALLRRRAVPYALATNSDGPYAGECLRRAGIATAFPIMVTRDQVAQGKPAPDLFLAAARHLDVAAAVCLVLEDSEAGLEAARAAGTIPVLVQPDPDQRARLRGRARLNFRSLEELVVLMGGRETGG